MRMVLLSVLAITACGQYNTDYHDLDKAIVDIVTYCQGVCGSGGYMLDHVELRQADYGDLTGDVCKCVIAP